MISGTETKRARRPIHLNSRLKRNSWVRREKPCTQKSTLEKKRVRSSRVAKALATKACCSRYRNHDTPDRKRNSWVRREKPCTQKSTLEKKRVRSSRVAKALATKACCSRYRNVDT